MLEIQVLAWDKYINVAELNWLMGSHPSPMAVLTNSKNQHIKHCIICQSLGRKSSQNILSF